MAFDHALSCQKIFDLLTEHGDIIVLLEEKDGPHVRFVALTHRTVHKMNNDAYLEPLWAFLAKAEALETETNASFTAALCIWALITFLKGGEKQKKKSTWE